MKQRYFLIFLVLTVRQLAFAEDGLYCAPREEIAEFLTRQGVVSQFLHGEAGTAYLNRHAIDLAGIPKGAYFPGAKTIAIDGTGEASVIMHEIFHAWGENTGQALSDEVAEEIRVMQAQFRRWARGAASQGITAQEIRETLRYYRSMRPQDKWSLEDFEKLLGPQANSDRNWRRSAARSGGKNGCACKPRPTTAQTAKGYAIVCVILSNDGVADGLESLAENNKAVEYGLTGLSWIFDAPGSVLRSDALNDKVPTLPGSDRMGVLYGEDINTYRGMYEAVFNSIRWNFSDGYTGAYETGAQRKMRLNGTLEDYHRRKAFEALGPVNVGGIGIISNSGDSKFCP